MKLEKFSIFDNYLGGVNKLRDFKYSKKDGILEKSVG